MQTEPTEKDIGTLARALELEERFGAGIFAHGGPQVSHYKRLCRFGMLEFTGEWGRDMDAIVDADVPIYRLTDQGRAWVRERQKEAA